MAGVAPLLLLSLRARILPNRSRPLTRSSVAAWPALGQLGGTGEWILGWWRC